MKTSEILNNGAALFSASIPFCNRDENRTRELGEIPATAVCRHPNKPIDTNATGSAQDLTCFVTGNSFQHL